MEKDSYILAQYLIADTEKIEQLRERFKFIDKDNINWTETYIDEETNNEWLYYRVDTYLQGGGYPILARQPLPDTKELIRLSLFSKNDDEVFAACRTLVDNEEIKKMDFRADLISELENINDKLRQERIINLTGLDKALNRREILGKSFEQIDLDGKYYEGIVDRASKLKAK